LAAGRVNVHPVLVKCWISF